MKALQRFSVAVTAMVAITSMAPMTPMAPAVAAMTTMAATTTTAPTAVAAAQPEARTALPQVVKTTHRFAVKDGQELFLDRYTVAEPATEPVTTAAVTTKTAEPLRPCIIFVFGGGFFTGSRDSGRYTAYFEHLARCGFEVVSTDYRLGMKDVRNPGVVEAVRGFVRTVDMAVEDLCDATCYVLAHAGEWGIDPARIVASGSSAGAITVLQAENDICNRRPTVAALPEEFNFGGVVSFAGAIFSLTGKPRWERTPCPMMLFHGTSDSNVPYRRGSLLGVGFYGSATIAEQLQTLGTPYFFYSVEYGDHSLAESPMTDNLDLVEMFVREYVTAGRRLEITERLCDEAHTDRPVEFTIFDYLGSNYGK